jgi:hypothetical protein
MMCRSEGIFEQIDSEIRLFISVTECVFMYLSVNGHQSPGMSKATQRFESITRVRSYLTPSNYADSAEFKEGFAEDILGLLNEGELDLKQIEKFRNKENLSNAEIEMYEKELELKKITAGSVNFRVYPRQFLSLMQFNIQPICSKDFCLLSLAMASDMGVNVRQLFSTPRINALLLGMHHRVGEKSELRKLHPETLELIIQMALI